MPLLQWNQSALKYFENGISKGILWVFDPDTLLWKTGQAWEGLSSVTETPGGAERTLLWANNTQYATFLSPETFEGSIAAYTSPSDFDLCDGTQTPWTGVHFNQQKRYKFALCYETRVHNDESGEDVGRKIHFIYNCQASPSETTRETVNDSPDAILFEWDFTSTPIDVSSVPGLEKFNALSKMWIDPDKLAAHHKDALELAIYGEDGGPGESTYTSPMDIYTILQLPAP